MLYWCCKELDDERKHLQISGPFTSCRTQCEIYRSWQCTHPELETLLYSTFHYLLLNRNTYFFTIFMENKLLCLGLVVNIHDRNKSKSRN